MGLIRLLLACSVVIEHSRTALGLKLLPGNLAVEMFFIISGFYMSLVLADKYQVGNWSGRLSFYASRFLRLWPAFLLTTVGVYVWWFIAFWYLGRLPTSAGDFRGLLADPLVFGAVQLSNLTMIGQDIPSLFHVSKAAGAHLTFGPAETLPDGSLWMGFMREIGPAWSIGTEIWFYLLVPFLVRLSGFWLVLLAVASLALRAAMYSGGLVPYFFFPAQLSLFLIGMLAHRHARRPWLLHPATACLGFVVVCAGAILFGSLANLDQTYKWLLYGAFALTISAIFERSKHSAADRSIGELSYPIYITHMLVLSVLVAVGKQLGISIGGEILLIVTILISWILYVLVDKPIGHWRMRLSREADRASGDVAGLRLSGT